MDRKSALKALLLFLLPFFLSLSYDDIRKAYYRSYQYEKVQDYENAIKALMPVYEKFPRAYTPNLRLGWLYYLKGNYANSAYHYEKAMKANPYSIEAKLGYTLPLLAQDKFSQVEKVCYRILSLDPYNYYANYRLLLSLKAQKKLDAALRVAMKMLAVYPTDVRFLTELGLLKDTLGRDKEAYAIFKDVLILDPENTTAKEFVSNYQKTLSEK